MSYSVPRLVACLTDNSLRVTRDVFVVLFFFFLLSVSCILLLLFVKPCCELEKLAALAPQKPVSQKCSGKALMPIH